MTDSTREAQNKDSPWDREKVVSKVVMSRVAPRKPYTTEGMPVNICKTRRITRESHIGANSDKNMAEQIPKGVAITMAPTATHKVLKIMLAIPTKGG